MNIETNSKATEQRSLKVLLLFIFLVVAVLFFLLSILKTITSDRRTPSHHATIHNRSLRGAIISADNYTLSSSQKTYQAVIRGESVNPDKKEIFIKLFSIYSGISEKNLRKKFKNRKGKEIKGNITISKSITLRHAMQLKSLAHKLRRLGVFRSIKNHNGVEVLYGLDIIENGETRLFPLGDVMSPILGYVGNKNNGRYTRPVGKKGIERNYDKHITSKKNGYFKGKRDVVGAVIHDKNSIRIQRVDGMDLHLNISLAFQRRVEFMLDKMKASINADEIIVGIMESKTGKVIGLASSERFNPAHITQKDITALNPKFSEYPYEAGSVLKPLTMAIALENKVVNIDTVFNTNYDRFTIGKGRAITDDHRFESLAATDIIVHSSNIGISQVSWKLTGKEFREGLLKFGIAKPSGLDLSRDLPGSLKSIDQLNRKMYRANSAYGYGMMVTFAQLFKAYSAFNNDGVAVTPYIVNYLQDINGNHYTLKPKIGNLKSVSKKTATQIHNILLEVVKRGTGVKAQYPGLEVGGKTGTAHISVNGRYRSEYHSSFYGFANDQEGHKYTIGVLVIRAKKYRKYFAAQSAVPTFRRTIDILVELDYLKPKDDIQIVSPAIHMPSMPPTSPILKEETQEAAIVVTKEAQKKKSVKSLFGIKEKRDTKAKPTPKPPKNKSPHELFEDLF